MSFYLNKSVLITGGSSGIGLATAGALVAQGAHVAIAARDERRLEEAVALVRRSAISSDQKITHVVMDVMSSSSVEEGTKRALAQLGDLDIVINNAGFAIPGYLEQLDEGDYDTMLQVNYLGAVRVIAALLPHFMQRRAGAVVNVTSMLGFMGTFGYAAYAGSKYALSGYTECIRQDLLPFGVSVHLCYPPTTKTPGLDAENVFKPAEAWAIEGSSRAFSADDVAKALLDGIRRKRFHILVGADSGFIWRAQRFVPWLVRWFTDGVLHKHLATKGDGRKALAEKRAAALARS